MTISEISTGVGVRSRPGGTITTNETVDWYRFEGGGFTANAMRNAWLLALATYGVGDVVTTIALVWFSPLHVEANPVIAGAIAHFGPGGFLAVKLLVFFAAIAVSIRAGYLAGDRLAFYGPPALLASVGSLVTLWNLTLLA